METPFLSVEIESKAYGVTPVLSDIAFTVPKGSFVSLLGPSGCGKTTLLRMMAGLDGAYVGRIALEGRPVCGPERRIGMMFQEARLLGWRNIELNVEFALPKELAGPVRRERIDHALQLVGLTTARKAWPSQVSGGMERRTALARALVNLPSMLLLDEPFSALDFAGKAKLWNELEAIHLREGLTTLLVTHDLEEALRLSDTIILLGKSPATIVKTFSVGVSRPRAQFAAELNSMRAELLVQWA